MRSRLLDAALILPLVYGFFYYVSRRFTEGYYSELGLPSGLLQLSAQDYLFTAARSPIGLELAIGFPWLSYRIYRIFRESRPGTGNRLDGKGSGAKRRDRPLLPKLISNTVRVGDYYLLASPALFAAGLLIVALFVDNPGVQTTLFTVFTVAFLITVVTSTESQVWLRADWPRIVLALTAIAWGSSFLLVGPESLGSATATNDVASANPPFQTVVLVAVSKHGPDAVNWAESGGAYESDRLQVIAGSETLLWLRHSESKSVFGVKVADVREIRGVKRP